MSEEIRYYYPAEPFAPAPSLEGALISPIGLIGKLDPITREYSVIPDPEGAK